jgi:hypothetical protein
MLISFYIFLFPPLKCALKGQRLTSAREVSAKVTGVLTGVSKNDFQECFQKLYECWKKRITARENFFEGIAVYIDVRLLTSV